MRFFFHMRFSDGRLDDPVGVEMRNITMAYVEALITVRSIVDAACAVLHEWDSWSIEIVDEAGTLLDVVPFTSVLRPQ